MTNKKSKITKFKINKINIMENKIEDDSENEDKDLKAAFDLFDRNNDKKIAISELVAIFKTLGHNLRERDI